MSTTALLTLHDSSEPSFLRFGTWSLFLHLGILALFGLIHSVNDIKEPTPIVQITLIDTPTIEAAHEEASAEAPPMKTVGHPMTGTPSAIPPPPHFSSAPMTLAQVAPPPLTPTPLPHVVRPVLQDQRATVALTLNSHFKTAQRPGTRASSSASILPPLNMPALPSPMTGNIPSITTIQPGLPTPFFLKPHQSAILTASPSRASGISKSKAGLGKTIPPVYPRIARESGWEGTVLVRVIIQADGSSDGIRVRKSSGHHVLDDAAIVAVKNWQFVPAKDGNIPVRSVIEIPIHFDLRQQG